jgi:ectoine hydroxylase-related dioxygenase (phytanoyl-CoA dioxygenase family)
MVAELNARYSLTPAQIAQFREQGFIKLKQVLSPAALEHYGREITDWVLRCSKETKPLAERDTYGKAFLQIMNLWTQSDVVKEFCFGHRLARLATELMGTRGVRMYHDQALYKEPGGGKTPWHADQYYWPLSNHNTVTAWVPLQATPLEMGPLAFSVGSHKYNLGRDIAISDESEARISKALLEQKLPMEESAFELGEVSFHYGWTFHRAGANQTANPRRVMTVIYMDRDMRLVAPANKNQQADWERWLPGVTIGEVAASPLNPVLYENAS